MNTFKTQAAQGDMLVMRVNTIPAKATEVAPEGAHVIVGHSETGHHHVLDRATVKMYRLPDEIYECFLDVSAPTPLTHLRPHDTHAPIMLAPGKYKVRRQREHTPEGFRRVED